MKAFRTVNTAIDNLSTSFVDSTQSWTGQIWWDSISPLHLDILPSRKISIYIFLTSNNLLFLKIFIEQKVCTTCSRTSYKSVPLTNLNKYLHNDTSEMGVCVCVCKYIYIYIYIIVNMGSENSKITLRLYIQHSAVHLCQCLCRLVPFRANNPAGRCPQCGKSGKGYRRNPKMHRPNYTRSIKHKLFIRVTPR
jgi:hypothetical protein